MVLLPGCGCCQGAAPSCLGYGFPDYLELDLEISLSGAEEATLTRITESFEYPSNVLNYRTTDIHQQTRMPLPPTATVRANKVSSSSTSESFASAQYQYAGNNFNVSLSVLRTYNTFTPGQRANYTTSVVAFVSLTRAFKHSTERTLVERDYFDSSAGQWVYRTAVVQEICRGGDGLSPEYYGPTFRLAINCSGTYGSQTVLEGNRNIGDELPQNRSASVQQLYTGYYDDYAGCYGLSSLPINSYESKVTLPCYGTPVSATTYHVTDDTLFPIKQSMTTTFGALEFERDNVSGSRIVESSRITNATMASAPAGATAGHSYFGQHVSEITVKMIRYGYGDADPIPVVSSGLPKENIGNGNYPAACSYADTVSTWLREY